MFLPSRDGIVGLESIFFQELLPTSDLEVEKGVSHTKDGVGHHGWGEVVGRPIDRDLGFIGMVAAWHVGPSVHCGGEAGCQLPLIADVGKSTGR